MTWQQMPQRVSEGAEKNFAHFSVWLQSNRPTVVDEAYFERLVAKAILFQACDRIVARMSQGGYKANVVTYAVAWLSYLTRQSLDLGGIWQRQGITPTIAEALEILAGEVWDYLTHPPASVRNISEWAKRPACWEGLKQRSVSVPGLRHDLVAAPSAIQESGSSANGHGQIPSLTIGSIPAAVWTAVERWGDATGGLVHWERGLAHTLSGLAATGRPATTKQVRLGLRIYDKAIRKGFLPPDGLAVPVLPGLLDP
jgi:hypothetical protein